MCSQEREREKVRKSNGGRRKRQKVQPSQQLPVLLSGDDLDPLTILNFTLDNLHQHSGQLV